MRHKKKVGAALAVAIAITAGCSSGGGAGPANNNSGNASDNPASSEGSTAPGATPSSGPLAQFEAMGKNQAIAALKGKLKGRNLAVGSSSHPNATTVGAFKALELLGSQFGVKTTFRGFNSTTLVGAIIGGQVQVAQQSLAAMAAANSNGGNFEAFGGDDQKNIYEIVTKASKGLTSVSALKGKSYGITSSLNSITGQTAQNCLKTAGLTVKDVQILKLGNTTNTTQAIASGHVDAAVTNSVRMTPLIAKDPKGYTVLCTGDKANPQINAVWYAKRDWIKKNPDMALALEISEIEADRWTHSSKSEWVQLAKKKIPNYTDAYAEIDYNTLVKTLDDWPVNGSLDRKLCDETLATSYKFRAISKPYTTDELVTFAYQKAALKILGMQ